MEQVRKRACMCACVGPWWPEFTVCLVTSLKDEWGLLRHVVMNQSASRPHPLWSSAAVIPSPNAPFSTDPNLWWGLVCVYNSMSSVSYLTEKAAQLQEKAGAFNLFFSNRVTCLPKDFLTLSGCIINFLIFSWWIWHVASILDKFFFQHCWTELQLWAQTFALCCKSVHLKERMTLMGSIPLQGSIKITFLSLLWCVIIPTATSHWDQSQHCRVIPVSLTLPVLEKRGDIILGGLFSLHDRVVEPNLSFTSTPAPTQCTQ